MFCLEFQFGIKVFLSHKLVLVQYSLNDHLLVQRSKSYISI